MCSAEMVGLSLARLQHGKTPGHDAISTYHLTNCHPLIHSLLAKLFNFMIFANYVPNDFGIGITIPIPKGDTNDKAIKVVNFRGITLSPLISKIFEYCLLDIMNDFLYSSDNQFGF